MRDDLFNALAFALADHARVLAARIPSVKYAIDPADLVAETFKRYFEKHPGAGLADVRAARPLLFIIMDNYLVDLYRRAEQARRVQLGDDWVEYVESRTDLWDTKRRAPDPEGGVARHEPEVDAALAHLLADDRISSKDVVFVSLARARECASVQRVLGHPAGSPNNAANVYSRKVALAREHANACPSCRAKGHAVGREHVDVMPVDDIAPLTALYLYELGDSTRAVFVAYSWLYGPEIARAWIGWPGSRREAKRVDAEYRRAIAQMIDPSQELS